jgi:hypothetical protein
VSLRSPPTDDEIRRLNAIIVAQASRIRELEDVVARAVKKGLKYRELQQYYDDAPRVDDI